MNLIKDPITIIEQNHLGHFVYLPKILGFEVYETNEITIINCALNTSMFNIVYSKGNDTISNIDKIKRMYNGQPVAWWIPPSVHSPNSEKTSLKADLALKHSSTL